MCIYFGLELGRFLAAHEAVKTKLQRVEHHLGRLTLNLYQWPKDVESEAIERWLCQILHGILDILL